MQNIINNVKNADKFILYLFNRKIKCSFLDLVMPIITFLGSSQFLFTFLVISIFIPSPKIHSLSIASSFSLVISGIITHIIKLTVNRQRPYIKISNLSIRKIGIDKYSFPSGHTTAAFALAVMLSLFFPSLSLLYLSIAFLVGISRMYLGVHYPSDVTIGTLIGILSSIIIYRLYI